MCFTFQIKSPDQEVSSETKAFYTLKQTAKQVWSCGTLNSMGIIPVGSPEVEIDQIYPDCL